MILNDGLTSLYSLAIMPMYTMFLSWSFGLCVYVRVSVCMCAYVCVCVCVSVLSAIAGRSLSGSDLYDIGIFIVLKTRTTNMLLAQFCSFFFWDLYVYHNVVVIVRN